MEQGVSQAVAADLRERGVPTVTGTAQWSATPSARDTLLNESVTGLIDPDGKVVIPEIIPQDVQDRLRDLFASDSREVFGYEHEPDPETGRKTSRLARDEHGEPKLILDPQTGQPKLFKVARNSNQAGNEPRWLVSMYAECGICDDGTVMRVTGSKDRRAYVCLQGGHLRRSAARVDDYISGRVIAYLARPDLADVLPVRRCRCPALTRTSCGLSGGG